ncbi:MAG: hypothetical protein VKO65_02025 [Cyanobacteriota bacterium]|nr:hypothetical protein [Cyanobacteriota bacterium]
MTSTANRELHPIEALLLAAMGIAWAICQISRLLLVPVRRPSAS